ncbi:hypothetical protein JM654_05290 [Microbacterium oxydans]|nr:hypothetical protein [Microbacterium oxydans]
MADSWLAEHAGFLRLPSGANDRWAFADDRGGALVVGGDAVRRIPIAIPAEHLACDPSGRHVVVTSGLGMNDEAWSDLVTVVDLATDSSTRFRARVGEPGVVVAPDQASGEPTIVLRHREPGAVETIPPRRGARGRPPRAGTPRRPPHRPRRRRPRRRDRPRLRHPRHRDEPRPRALRRRRRCAPGHRHRPLARRRTGVLPASRR